MGSGSCSPNAFSSILNYSRCDSRSRRRGVIDAAPPAAAAAEQPAVFHRASVTDSDVGNVVILSCDTLELIKVVFCQSLPRGLAALHGDALHY